MPCHVPSEKGLKKAADCQCYEAVMRVYETLSAQEPPMIALDAARRVYSYHHPEDSRRDAYLTVESWVHAGRSH